MKWFVGILVGAALLFSAWIFYFKGKTISAPLNGATIKNNSGQSIGQVATTQSQVPSINGKQPALADFNAQQANIIAVLANPNWQAYIKGMGLVAAEQWVFNKAIGSNINYIGDYTIYAYPLISSIITSGSSVKPTKTLLNQYFSTYGKIYTSTAIPLAEAAFKLV